MEGVERSRGSADEPVGLPTAVGLGLVLAFSALPVLQGGTAPADLTSRQLLESDALKWGVALVVLAIVVYWEREPLSSVGVRRPRPREAAVGVGAGLAAIVGQAVLQAVGVDAGSSSAALEALLALPLVQRVELVLTAAVTEELLYRSYPIERLWRFTGSVALAGAVTAAAFVAVHLPLWGLGWGPSGLWNTLVFTAVYVRRRSLVACVCAHATVDGIGLLVYPLVTS